MRPGDFHKYASTTLEADIPAELLQEVAAAASTSGGIRPMIDSGVNAMTQAYKAAPPGMIRGTGLGLMMGLAAAGILPRQWQE